MKAKNQLIKVISFKSARKTVLNKWQLPHMLWRNDKIIIGECFLQYKHMQSAHELDIL